MFLKKLQIENFKCFTDNVILNLDPNVNKIETDLEKKYFTKIDNEYRCNIIGITGRNSSGKSTILEAILEFQYLLSDISASPNSFVDVLFKRKIIKNKEQFFRFHKNLISVYKECEKINQKIKGVNIDTITNIEKIYGDYKSTLEFESQDNINDKVIIDIEFVKDVFNEDISLRNAEWKKRKHFKDNDSEIVLKATLYDEKSKNTIDVTISGNSSYAISYSSKEQIDQDTINSIKHFFNQITLINSDKINRGEYSDRWLNNILKACESKINLNSKDKKIKFLLDVIRLADDSIDEIVFQKDTIESGIKSFLLNDGTKIFPNELSDGTLRFIYVLDNILTACMRGNSLILIDEIETNLHSDLVNIIKQIIYLYEANVQLIFTSHNYNALTSNMSNKQLFYIGFEENDRVIKKVSSKLQNDRNTQKAFEEKYIGSHPSFDDLRKFISYFDAKQNK